MFPSRTQEHREFTLSTLDTDVVRFGSLPDQPSVLSVGKALAIVELLMRFAEPLSARAIAEHVGINRTTAHRLLRALMQRGWIEKPTGTAAYRLGLKFLALAHVATSERNFLLEVRPALEPLSRLSRETIHVGVADGFDVVHVDRIESLERVGVASKIGSRAPLHTTALGKALLAAGSSEFVDEYIRFARDRTPPYPKPDEEALRAEIGRTRTRGYSIDDEDDSIGVRCLGVAIVGSGGVPLFAVSITGPSPRFTRAHVEQYAPDVIRVGQQLSRQLGWSPSAASSSGRRMQG
jgi:IclR family transcriptional regulator, KDG regulon repressor